MTKMQHGRHDDEAMKGRIAGLEKALASLEAEELHAEGEFNRTKSQDSWERLARAKTAAHKARAELNAHRQALASAARMSEWTHPDFDERIPRWREARSALGGRLAPGFLKPPPSKDAIIRYALDAAGKLWNF
jgi:hypothetical protein